MSQKLTDVSSVGPSVAAALIDNDIRSVKKLAKTKVKELDTDPRHWRSHRPKDDPGGQGVACREQEGQEKKRKKQERQIAGSMTPGGATSVAAKLDILEQLKKCLYVYIAPTQNCGYGIYAAKEFKQGETIIVNDNLGYFLDEMTRETALRKGYDIAKDCFEHKPGCYLAPEGNIDDFMNHSCCPNTGLIFELDRYIVRALVDIGRDSEITYDYSTYTFSNEDVFDCLCNSENCRKVVGTFSTLPKALQKKYIALGVTWTG